VGAAEAVDSKHRDTLIPRPQVMTQEQKIFGWNRGFRPSAGQVNFAVCCCIRRIRPERSKKDLFFNCCAAAGFHVITRTILNVGLTRDDSENFSKQISNNCSVVQQIAPTRQLRRFAPKRPRPKMVLSLGGGTNMSASSQSLSNARGSNLVGRNQSVVT